jgi:hypothetical protein
MLKFIIAGLFIFLVFDQAQGQYYETGQDPSSLKWNQINTEHFKIVFPNSYSQQAAKFTFELEKAYQKLNKVYPLKKFKLPVIIHSNSINSNGYVSWAPKRMEIYPLPDQDNIPMDLPELFALHELDHAMVMQTMNHGFSKGISFLFGEQVTGALSVFFPLWFLEGDAVFSETAFSSSGRGTNPAFVKRLKALTLEKNDTYKYDKMIGGSYKDYTPDHYQFGYQMVAWSKKNYTNKLWNNALLFTSQKPYTLNPVNFSLRKTDNLTKKKIYYKTIDSLKVEWRKEDSENQSIQYSELNPSKKGEFVNYYSPLAVGADSIVAIKTSLSEPVSFVLIVQSGEKEKQIHSPGSMYSYFFSYGKGKLVWAEIQPDPRWENRGFSVIKVFDIKNNKTTQLTWKSRLMAPSISPDGKLIVASESTTEYQNSLVIIDAISGTRIKTIPTPDNVFPQRPQWSNDGKITIVFLASNGEGIMSYNYKTGYWGTLIPTSRNDLQSAYLKNDSLFFVSSMTGTDNIFLQTPNNELFQLTSSRFGAYDLNLNNSSLLFTDYTSTGYKISRIPLYRQSISILSDSTVPADLTSENAKQEFTNLSGNPEIPEFNTEPYNKFQHLFRFHSWMPFFADLEKIQTDPLSINPGITLLSQNLLGTLTSTVGYEYNNKNPLLHANIKWKAIYPTIDASLVYGGIPDILSGTHSNAEPSSIKKGQTFTTNIILPLTFSYGKYTQQVSPSLSVSYNNKYIFIPEKHTFDYGQVRLTGRFYFANYSKSAQRDIFPRFGQVFDYSYTFSPYDKEIYGPVNSLKTTFYFPGIFRNQGLRFRYETELQKPEMYLMYNKASFPRGYKNIIAEDLQFYSADYAIPLLYPDFNLVSLIYIKRIRTNLFCDYAEGTGNSYIDTGINHAYKETFNAIGFELLSDFYVLRMPFMITAGMQTSYLSVSKSAVFKLIFNIDIFGQQISRSKL